jgi:hypothetical protein
MSILASAENAKKVESNDENEVEQFRVRKLIKHLTEARGFFFPFSPLFFPFAFTGMEQA